ncbi:60S ribosomal protein L18a-1 [Glycine soja]
MHHKWVISFNFQVVVPKSRTGSLIKLVYFSRHEDQSADDKRKRSVKEGRGTKQFHNSKIKFPLVYKKVRPATRKLNNAYKAKKPNLFM